MSARRARSRVRLLTIAGSDSGGGAGIQADLKTFAAFGGYGMSAVTAVTAQNTRTVRALALCKPALVSAQIAAVAEDLGIDAAKTGMLGSAAIVRAVAAAVRRYAIAPLVVDPVMVSKSGVRLLDRRAESVLERELLPLAALVTPNLAEAGVLLGRRIRTEAALERSAIELFQALGVPVLVKGGHLPGRPVDVLASPEGLVRFVGRRQPSRATHGAGCTLSAAITAGLAHRLPLEDAIAVAKGYLEEAMAHAPRLGAGVSPPDHLVRSGRPNF
ncbi:MAG TPA: bifunctional hydroxymethylpyrimidine kinase/phosphomethylpyrimidine kinase [Candidatus Udaeobacter sp.]|nr:bifunctional hydroxymethylpyrimidine kinase/phosphomethylpyrimidine kinase [Candidatus Udaeobacter sp.]